MKVFFFILSFLSLSRSFDIFYEAPPKEHTVHLYDMPGCMFSEFYEECLNTSKVENKTSFSHTFYGSDCECVELYLAGNKSIEGEKTICFQVFKPPFDWYMEDYLSLLPNTEIMDYNFDLTRYFDEFYKLIVIYEDENVQCKGVPSSVHLLIDGICNIVPVYEVEIEGDIVYIQLYVKIFPWCKDPDFISNLIYGFQMGYTHVVVPSLVDFIVACMVVASVAILWCCVGSGFCFHSFKKIINKNNKVHTGLTFQQPPLINPPHFLHANENIKMYDLLESNSVLPFNGMNNYNNKDLKKEDKEENVNSDVDKRKDDVVEVGESNKTVVEDVIEDIKVEDIKEINEEIKLEDVEGVDDDEVKVEDVEGVDKENEKEKEEEKVEENDIEKMNEIVTVDETMKETDIYPQFEHNIQRQPLHPCPVVTEVNANPIHNQELKKQQYASPNLPNSLPNVYKQQDIIKELINFSIYFPILSLVIFAQTFLNKLTLWFSLVILTQLEIGNFQLLEIQSAITDDIMSYYTIGIVCGFTIVELALVFWYCILYMNSVWQFVIVYSSMNENIFIKILKSNMYNYFFLVACWTYFSGTIFSVLLSNARVLEGDWESFYNITVSFFTFGLGIFGLMKEIIALLSHSSFGSYYYLTKIKRYRKMNKSVPSPNIKISLSWFFSSIDFNEILGDTLFVFSIINSKEDIEKMEENPALMDLEWGYAKKLSTEQIKDIKEFLFENDGVMKFGPHERIRNNIFNKSMLSKDWIKFFFGCSKK